MKKTENKKSFVYGVIGMVALVFIGGIIGYILNGSNHINRSMMTEEQCQTLTKNLSYAVNHSKYDEIETLNKIYSENCVDRDFPKVVSEPKQNIEEDKMPDTTCGKIEMLLNDRLHDVEDHDAEAHIYNSKVYMILSERGCAENSEKYKALAEQELEIARALNGDTNDMSTCAQIERVLTQQLQCTDGYNICMDPDTHIDNAKIYANLSERGCVENSEKYKALAKQELEIARALNDDSLNNERESIEIVETYKRLQMQAEAERMIEKAKKLTNPAIDFIIQLERIIEE